MADEMESSLLSKRSDDDSNPVDGSAISSITSSPYWNITLLALAWSWTLTTSTLLTTIGPLSARELGASDSFAAFTIGIFLVGAAVSSVPSAFLFRRFGRFWGFSIGCLAQMAGSVLGVSAMVLRSQVLLYLGCFSVGLGQGLGQFYRFSAVEVSPDHLKSRAVTYVLSGGIIAAFLGPTSADQTVNFAGKPYVGSFATMALIGILNELTIMLVQFPKKKPTLSLNASSNSSSLSEQILMQTTRRKTSEIIAQPLFMVSCAVATLAHTIMVMLMSNVELAMQSHGYSMTACSLVMELHFFAMFSPGFYTGSLIKKHGTFVVAVVGGLIFAGSIVVLSVGTQSWNYIFGMILVGVGWNFSFSSGTVMLTSSYKPIEATDVQAINDVILFTVAGAGSLISGALFSYGGWLLLIYVVSGLVLVNLGLFLVAWGLRAAVDKGDIATVQDAEDDEEEAYSSSGGRSAKASFDTTHSVSYSEGRDGLGSLHAFPDRSAPEEVGGRRTRSRGSRNPSTGSFSADGGGTQPRKISFAGAEIFAPESQDTEDSSLMVRTMSVS